MALSLEAATLRAALRRQLKRLNLRPQEGGPYVVYRDGQLLVSGDKTMIVSQKMVDELECLRKGTSLAEVWKVIELNQ